MTDAPAGPAAADAPLVRIARDDRGAVSTLTLDSPHNRNALSTRLMTELHDGLAAAAADDDVRAVLLTHTGNTFCAGADLGEATEAVAGTPGGSGTGTGPGPGPGDGAGPGPGSGAAAGAGPAGRTDGPLALARLLRAVVECPKPVVARVTGHVRAGGLGLLGACDIAAAGTGATFAFTEARLGLAPAVISMPLLPRLDARAAARYYLTGERFGPEEAARIGLVTLAGDDVDALLTPVLDGLRAASPQGLAASKRLVTGEVLRAFDRDTEPFAELSASLFASPEAREGMTAFLERREPKWFR